MSEKIEVRGIDCADFSGSISDRVKRLMVEYSWIPQLRKALMQAGGGGCLEGSKRTQNPRGTMHPTVIFLRALGSRELRCEYADSDLLMFSIHRICSSNGILLV